MDDEIITVLVDQSEDRAEITTILEEEGYTVVSCEQPNELYELIGTGSVAVVILDQHVSDQAGDAVCGVIRRRFPGIPLQILLVAKAPNSVQDCLNSGGDDFVCKPILRLEFLTRIRASLIRERAQRDIYTERDFFRNAVRYEEELSNRILDQHLHLKEAFANIEKINQELETSNRRLEKIARFDILSGLLNRMSLFHAIDIEIERAVRTGRNLSGIMVDLDFFKMINDNHGHLAGDEAIRMVGKVLIQEMRRYDQAGRYGGEEFFVVLPDSNGEQALGIAERLRKKLESSPFFFDRKKISLTASFGVTTFRPGESREHWIGRADRAMYQAKQGGRNRVVLLV
ncbi:GGDEF domain-containing response regulator [Sediminispirochaeta bajacaliforniensis]|uniref:GGDEF domain-containing response regulator n=1 Tax=Sediminispirochaeta bajacaliforniensis TaxID=148 RepID=UPI000378FB15|nr:diguanylate cyclase [Sediminispirochaeta bajacaliforniensis]